PRSRPAPTPGADHAEEAAFWKDEWHQWVRYLEMIFHGGSEAERFVGTGEVTGINPDAILFVWGIHGPVWSARLEGMRVRIAGGGRSLKNIVYCSHLYRRDWRERGKSDAGTANDKALTSEPNHSTSKNTWRWLLNIDNATRTPLPLSHPVFVAEWGAETK